MPNLDVAVKFKFACPNASEELGNGGQFFPPSLFPVWGAKKSNK